MAIIKFSKSIFESINDKNLFKAVFLAGGGGSGKSYISGMITGNEDKELNLSPFGIKLINSDTFFEFGLKKAKLPMNMVDVDKDTNDKQMAVRELAKGVADSQIQHYLNGMLPIMIDGTAKDYDKIVSQAEALKGIGYDVAMVLVDVDLEVALARNKKRKRKVPEEVIIKANAGVKANKSNYKNYFGSSNYFEIDNNKHLSDNEEKALAEELFKVGKKFITSPLKNPIGLSIIKLLKETKGKYLSDLPEAIDYKFFKH